MHGFVDNLNAFPSYELREWSKLELAQSLALPAFAVQNQLLPYWYFYFGAPIMKAGVPDSADPRVRAASIAEQIEL